MHTEDAQLTVMHWHMKRFMSYVFSKDLWSVAQIRPPHTPQLVWGVGGRNIYNTKICRGFFELDSIIRAEGSVLDPCYKIGE